MAKEKQNAGLHQLMLSLADVTKSRLTKLNTGESATLGQKLPDVLQSLPQGLTNGDCTKHRP